MDAFGSGVEFFNNISSTFEHSFLFYKKSLKVMIDGLDKELLNILIVHGRDSVRTITKKLAEKGIKISERGIAKRIAKLEREKVILGYTALVDLKQVNMAVPRLITVKFTSPQDFVKRLDDMKEYLRSAPFCDFSARTNGNIDWIELKFFNNSAQAQKEEVMYRTWFGDIIEDYRSYDLDIHKFGWQLFDEQGFERFMLNESKKEKRCIQVPNP